MTSLTGPARPAASGTADSLVIFLHGYGADGNDLIGLAEPLAPHLPNTRFLAPNAPERCVEQPDGLPVVSDPLARRHARGGGARRGGARPSRLLDGWLDAVAAEGIAPERTVLVGFSQGTMMALHVGLRRAAPFAGHRRLLRAAARARAAGRRRSPSRPPVLLVHGDQDPMVPFASLAEADDGAERRRGRDLRPMSRAASGTASRRTASALALGFIRERLALAGMTRAS